LGPGALGEPLGGPLGVLGGGRGEGGGGVPKGKNKTALR